MKGKTKLKIAALVSGSGRNLQSIIDSIEAGELDAEVAVVIASRDAIPALDRAKRYGIVSHIVSRKAHSGDISTMGIAISEILRPYQIDLILLCGYLSFLSPELVQEYQGRIMNIHPSLLPAFGGQGAYGMNVHKAVIEHGVKVSGCTVFFVDAGEDTGQIILQRAIPVNENDTAQSLAQRVLAEEFIAYTDAVKLFAAGRLIIEGQKVRVSHE
jgi:phosphoribosylglycinamide formyltransferase-1